MGGFFGVASTTDCVADLFYGTDYHSHLGTRRGGLVTAVLGHGRVVKLVAGDTKGVQLSIFADGMFAGVPIGLMFVVVAGGFQLMLPRMVFTPPIYWAGTFGGVFLQTLGYAGGMLLLCARWPDGLVARGLAAVGRTALSNYLAQSAVLGLVFYSTGFGLFTRLTALPVVALSIPVFALQVWASQVWLGRFTIGPVEWAWRSLTYGSRLPLRRTTAVVAS